MKKSTFGLLATAALIFTPVAAFAQDSQQNLQLNRTAGAAVGEGNFVHQTTDQMNYQTQYDVNGYGYGAPSTQTSVQDNMNDASAAGYYNSVDQNVYQQNDQYNDSINTYPDLAY